MARYLRSAHGGSDGRERVHAYLEELRTTQRYPFYRALKHPLYPILRKIDRRVEHLEIVESATRAGRVIYASNHRSHTDYLVEPLVLDDNGVRPPIIAAGINLFGGPLGLIHKHVTGAIPIRRNTKDPAYLITLKAYVAELLRTQDLLFYPEGGRSYSGELKPPKTGLLHAALLSGTPGLTIVPTAIAYDLVLEDHILARQGVKRSQRPFCSRVSNMKPCRCSNSICWRRARWRARRSAVDSAPNSAATAVMTDSNSTGIRPANWPMAGSSSVAWRLNCTSRFCAS